MLRAKRQVAVADYRKTTDRSTLANTRLSARNAPAAVPESYTIGTGSWQGWVKTAIAPMT